MRCLGCQGEFPNTPGPTHEYILSSPGCWAAFGKVLAREYSDPALMRLHKLTVDAYAVQHPGVDVPAARRSVAIHLSRLCLLLELKLSIEQVGTEMPRILAMKQERPWLAPPGMLGTRNVLSLALPMPAAEHERAVRAWAESVWDAWSPHHPLIRRWCAGL